MLLVAKKIHCDEHDGVVDCDMDNDVAFDFSACEDEVLKDIEVDI